MYDLSKLESLEARRLFAAAVIGSVAAPLDVRHARRDVTVSVGFSSQPNGGIDVTSLNTTAVQLFQLDNAGHVVDANGTAAGNAVKTNNAQTSGGGDTLSLQPANPLLANTVYRFDVNQPGTPSNKLIKDIGGVAVTPFSFSFTTSTEIAIANPNINFTHQVQSAAGDRPYTSVTIGPDHKLYAATTKGQIFRWVINSDGTLGTMETIDTVLTNNVDAGNGNPNGYRLITGIAFDPASTQGNLRLWVSHGEYKFGTVAGQGNGPTYQADNYSGEISLLDGANLQNYTREIIHIPRSVKDHMNNQPVFDRTGANFYFVLAAMNAMGRGDTVWGGVEENQYSAAMFKVNLTALDDFTTVNGAVDFAPNSGYDPYDTTNPVTIYADGIRNAFDMVFHSNGHLYSGVNGSSAGGNTPGTPADLSTVPSSKRLDFASRGAYSGPVVPALNGVLQTEEDVLLDVKPGKYYGHPNPTRGEYVLDGGNPTSGVDPYEFAGTHKYPDGTQPDRNYTLPALDLGKNVSPDGMIEYTGNAFGGLLDGYLLIARYNSGADLVAIKPNSDGSIDKAATQTRITGLTGFDRPLDVIEDKQTGNLYVAQMPDEISHGNIVLLRPTAINPHGATTTDNSVPTRLSVYVTPGDPAGVTKTVNLVNTGTTTLVLDRSATKITSGPSKVAHRKADRVNFKVTNLPDDDISILPGESYAFTVVGVLQKGRTDTAYANLAFATNEPGKRYTVVNLRAFSLTAAGTLSTTLASTSALTPSVFSARPIVASPSDGVVKNLDGTDAPWQLDEAV